jgi:Fe2+-dicitrate sensor, membrane component
MSAEETTGSDLPPEVQSWLDEHPEVNAETFDEVWQLSGEIPPAMDPDPGRIDAMRDDLHRAIAADQPHTDAENAPSERASTKGRRTDRSPTDRTESRWAWTRWAGQAIGTTVLLVLLAAGLYLFAVPNRITVPPGQTETVSLPDGSTAELNSGTTLRYPRWWHVNFLRSWLGRSVELEGEAFFSVVETGTPFRVETANAEVRVLGTRFNVRSRRIDGQPETEVVVAEGRVALTAGGATTHLDSAQAATVKGTGPPSSSKRIRVDQRLAWCRGGFSFADASIQAIAAEVERRFDVSITIRPDVEARPVTLQVRDAKGAEPLLQDICRAAGCRVESTTTGFVIQPR